MPDQILGGLLNRSGLRSKPPSPNSFFGAWIGMLDRSTHCWELKGEVQIQFESQLFPNISKHLEHYFESGPTGESLTISGYMIGTSLKSAAPTVLFISRCSQTRKNARKVVKANELLSNFSNFKTAHHSKDPGLAIVSSSSLKAHVTVASAPQGMEFLASGSTLQGLDERNHDDLPVRVYFDESKPFSDIGQTIYIRHSSGFSTATSNVVQLKGRVLLQTVYHAFCENFAITEAQDESTDSDNDFEIDSDTEFEDDSVGEIDVEYTSLGSESSGSPQDCSSSEVEDLLRSSSPPNQLPLETGNTMTQSPATNESHNRIQIKYTHDLPAQESFVSANSGPIIPDNLVLVGRLFAWSVDADWALINFSNQKVKDDVSTMLKSQEHLFLWKSSKRRDVRTPICTWTASGGRLEGYLSDTTSYIKLPGSRAFQDVYRVQLKGLLTTGDCGSVVFDAHSKDIYGHIVAGSRATGVAYIVAADKVAKTFQAIDFSYLIDQSTSSMPDDPIVSSATPYQSNSGLQQPQAVAPYAGGSNYMKTRREDAIYNAADQVRMPHLIPNSNWIWSQDHKQHYRQELVEGAWVTIWANQLQPAPSTASPRIWIDSKNQDLHTASLLTPYYQSLLNANNPTQVSGSSQGIYYPPGLARDTFPRADPTLRQGIPRQPNYQPPRLDIPYIGGSNYTGSPLTLRAAEHQHERTVDGGYNRNNMYFEEVGPSFYVRGSSFFTIGKLIAVIFTEEASPTAVTDYNSAVSKFSYVRFGHRVHTQIRRFIIVRSQREFSYACPIFTYGGRATLKPGVRADEHAIAYSSCSTAKLLPGETGIRKQPICVVDAEGVGPLDKASRIYFGIHYPIQHNFKVKDLGCVRPSDISRLRSYWTMANQDSTNQDIEVTAAAREGEEEDDNSGDGSGDDSDNYE